MPSTWYASSSAKRSARPRRSDRRAPACFCVLWLQAALQPGDTEAPVWGPKRGSIIDAHHGAYDTAPVADADSAQELRRLRPDLRSEAMGRPAEGGVRPALTLTSAGSVPDL